VETTWVVAPPCARKKGVQGESIKTFIMEIERELAAYGRRR
jgi:hypothetical protein